MWPATVHEDLCLNTSSGVRVADTTLKNKESQQCHIDTRAVGFCTQKRPLFAFIHFPLLSPSKSASRKLHPKSLGCSAPEGVLRTSPNRTTKFEPLPPPHSIPLSFVPP
ncbi:hypothetical protein CEXT_735591 [Caerostris extrusa]|uniref:Uncharacterized protein n=1 Tax=Caerostris extrusa TaxID=172846 RepID=A0AAV4Y8N7_CAEEX|nr:hypothetical protein CEXT_735591 [Caerostris extrusa]